MGGLVVFEGIDGSGKSTQAKLLYDRLKREGYDAVLTGEPGGSPLSEDLGAWLKGFPHRSALTELFLFSAARSEHVERLIVPALCKGQIVVCDRFTGSTLAYQGYGRGLDLEFIRQVNSKSTGDVEAALTVLMDVPLEVSQSRKAGSSLDVFEQERADFYLRVREGYKELAAGDPGRWLVVDGVAQVERVSEAIWQRVRKVVG